MNRHPESHQFVWAGWLKNAKLNCSTDAFWCPQCGAFKTRQWGKAQEPRTKVTFPGQSKSIRIGTFVRRKP
jgi:hypothetical protein